MHQIIERTISTFEWHIVSGPFETRREAEALRTGCKSTDIYDVTEDRNLRIITYNQMRRLRTGIPPRRIGAEGAWRMLEKFRAAADVMAGGNPAHGESIAAE